MAQTISATTGPHHGASPQTREHTNRQSPLSGSAQDQETTKAVERLKAAERNVRAHEQAHKAAGGRYAGAVSYSYTRGPDGRMYVTGGEVAIDVSPAQTPEETIQKMQQVQRAALAPADPSPQDRAVAAQAQAMMLQARAELMRDQADTGQDGASAIIDLIA